MFQDVGLACPSRGDFPRASNVSSVYGRLGTTEQRVEFFLKNGESISTRIRKLSPDVFSMHLVQTAERFELEPTWRWTSRRFFDVNFVQRRQCSQQRSHMTPPVRSDSFKETRIALHRNSKWSAELGEKRETSVPRELSIPTLMHACGATVCRVPFERLNCAFRNPLHAHQIVDIITCRPKTQQLRRQKYLQRYGRLCCSKLNKYASTSPLDGKQWEPFSGNSSLISSMALFLRGVRMGALNKDEFQDSW